MSAQEIEQCFPRLVHEGYEETSPEDNTYNCIAWAGDDNQEKWDPDITTGRHWPQNVPRTLELSSFIALYAVEGGYVPCQNGELEPGFEKIAIFLNLAREVEHASKQLPDGTWTSKLGDWEDITHKAPSSLEGNIYGTVAQFLKRPR